MISWEKREGNLLWRALEDNTVLLFVYDAPHEAANIVYRHEWTAEEWASLVMGAAAGPDNVEEDQTILEIHRGYPIDLEQKE